MRKVQGKDQRRGFSLAQLRKSLAGHESRQKSRGVTEEWSTSRELGYWLARNLPCPGNLSLFGKVEYEALGLLRCKRKRRRNERIVVVSREGNWKEVQGEKLAPDEERLD